MNRSHPTASSFTPSAMNSPLAITSRANRKRAPSLETQTTPLLPSISQRRSERRAQDEAALREHRMHTVTGRHCWTIYAVLALLYTAVVGTVYLARRPGAFVPSLPEMDLGETLPGVFNPYTALSHLEAITTTPHPFNSRANTDITKEYILRQFEQFQAQANALGRHNVRYDDQVDNTTWKRFLKSAQQKQMEEQGETDPSDGSALQPELHEVVQGDNLVMWVGGVVESMEGDVPVQIEIDIDQENQAALLVSAHYDSVATSNGETDDGGGVAVILAMIQHFIDHPVQHTVIFILNNAEELGLLGAAAFMGAPPNSTSENGSGHPWKKYIKAFLNLEGAGSGGPSLLFRASNYDIVRHYADSAPFPHASVVADAGFQLGLINSGTDFEIYSQHGLPGLDIAFYQRRSMYHSVTDGLPIESLFHMGSNAQATITSLCNSDYLDSLQPSVKGREEPVLALPRAWLSGKSVYYDILGKFMVFSELWTALLINTLALGVGLPVAALAFAYAAIARRQRRATLSHTPEPNPTRSLRSVLRSSSVSMMGNSDDGYGSVPQRHSNGPPTRQQERPDDLTDSIHYNQPKRVAVARTTVLVGLIIIADLAAVLAASRWQIRINPLARFSYPWLAVSGLACLLWTVNTLAVYVFTALESWIFGSVPIARGAAQWTLAIGTWWWIVVIVVGSGVAGWAGTGALYGTTVLAVSSGGAALIQIVLSLSKSGDTVGRVAFGWILVLALGVLASSVVVLDLMAIVVYMTTQSLIENDTGAMYLIYGVLLIPILLPAIPAISRGRHFRKALAIEIVLLVAIVWLLSWVQPFTASTPNSVYFFQHYNQTARTSTVNLRTDGGTGYIQRMLSDMNDENLCDPKPLEGEYMTEGCHFQPKRQIFEDDGQDQPIQVDKVATLMTELDDWRETRLEIRALETRICTVQLAETSPGCETQLWSDFDGAPEPGQGEGNSSSIFNHRRKVLRVFPREWNHIWSVIVRVKKSDQCGDRKALMASDDGIDSSDKLVPLTVLCGYDDWPSAPGYASVYNEIQAHIPDWIRMKSSALGLFSVSVDLEV